MNGADYMKHRICVVIINCLIFTTLCGCTRYQKFTKQIYDTDVYGVYAASVHNGNDYSDNGSISLLSNNTFSFERKTTNGTMGTEEYQCGGSFTVEDVNSDFTKLLFSISDEFGRPICSYSSFNCINEWNTCLYKYKNMLGEYIKMDTANIKSRSRFKINDNNDNDTFLLFTEDGLCRPSTYLDDNGYASKYKVKSHIIWIDYYGSGFRPAYFIVEDGLFNPNSLIKSR